MTERRGKLQENNSFKGSPQLTIIHLTTVWNYHGFRNGALLAIKHFWPSQNTPLPLPQSCDCDLGVWRLVMTGCQVSYHHVIAISNIPCQFPQKVNQETRREACKLLPPADRTPSRLCGLAETAAC